MYERQVNEVQPTPNKKLVVSKKKKKRNDELDLISSIHMPESMMLSPQEGRPPAL